MIGRILKRTILLAKAKGMDISAGSRLDTGRVMLFLPSYPGAHKSGYALRSRIVWWLHTGEVLRGLKYNIHHKNSINNDDRFSNLEKLPHGTHSNIHNTNPASNIKLKCNHCSTQFEIKRWRLKDGSRGKFCSQKCYQDHPKKIVQLSMACAWCSKNFYVTKFKAKERLFCSQSCSAYFSWDKRK